MTFRRMLTAVLAVVSFGAVAAVEFASPADAATTTETPVMGPSLLNADQLAHWYNARGIRARRGCRRSDNDVRALAQTVHRRGRGRRRARRHRVRAVHARDRRLRLLRLGRSGPSSTTTAGSTRTTVAAGARRAPRRCSTSRWRRAASRRRRSVCARRSSCCAATPTRRRATLPGRIRHGAVRPRRATRRSGSTSAATTARRGKLHLGVGATTTALRILQLYSQRARVQRRARRVRAVRPRRGNDPEVRQRLLGRRRATRGVYSFGSAQFYGGTGESAAEPAARRRRVASSDGTGYWLLGARRRHLLVRQRAVLRLDRWPSA